MSSPNKPRKFGLGPFSGAMPLCKATVAAQKHGMVSKVEFNSVEFYSFSEIKHIRGSTNIYKLCFQSGTEVKQRLKP